MTDDAISSPLENHLLKIAAVLATIGSPAFAGVTVENCLIVEDWPGFRPPVACDFTNTGPTAIDQFHAAVTITEEGRTFPWFEGEGETVNIPGGMEPGETVNLMLIQPSLPSRAVIADLVISVTVAD
jgi:hypothetical protein